MRLQFYDTQLGEFICGEKMISSIAEAPSAGDTVILLTSEPYTKLYGHDNRTGSVTSRLIDYRFETITVFVD